MSISKHIKEHVALGIRFNRSANTYAVGSNASYSTLAAAITARNLVTPTLLTSFTGSKSTIFGGTTIIADSGTPLTAYIGEEIGFKIGTGTTMIVGFVEYDNQIVAKYPIIAPVTAATIYVYMLNRAVIELLPGYRESISSNITLPSFTTFYCKDQNAELYSSAAIAFGMESGANEIRFNGIILNGNKDITVSNLILFQFDSNGSNLEQSDFYFKNCTFNSGHIDNLYFAETANGGLFLDNCNIYGYYDTFRLRGHREIVVQNSRIKAISSVAGDSPASCFALGSLYPYKLRVLNCTLEGVSDNGVAKAVKTIDFRNASASGSEVEIRSCRISAKQYSASATTTATAINGGTGTCSVSVSDTLFDITNAGSGTKLTMVAATSTLPIYYNNISHAPGSSTNISGAYVLPAGNVATAFAATVTPDAMAGDTVTVGALTGNITIGAPTNPSQGRRLTLNFVQDGTGTRTITLNAVFLGIATNVIAAGTAGQKMSVSFTYDGAAWLLNGGVPVWG